ncbi:odorant receptor 131-2-like [Hippoglossus hippoglossus]|uniref:odorant receptor 131-2-like n=1 Tax=Hippoglossus hippoglossus TaxID=8267 RepID=UPI00148C51C5|nr:odorant receptor 131-2-like [Hippoglossus hippoglossus]
MLSANLSLNNVTAGAQYQGLLERLLFSSVTSVPCCIFFFINVTMLFTLRSKAVFRESSRYILLYNLLVADTMQMTLSQLMYLLAVCRTRLSYPVCGLLVMLVKLTNEVSPLTLVVMSLERYVAVCQPLRHATIITITNTALAIIVVWAISSLNVLVRVLLLLDFPFENLDTLQMKDFCSDIAMLIGLVSDDYDKAYTCFVFVSATVVITSTYIGVMVAARSASTDKASAHV